ncbi:SAVED domain-containing protein [Celeribacter baekdonensis]|uniref:SAVED domain-containing protein n=1 Tax=Celeribacter baekdonensis TaxID=875171 RepID=UPI003A8E21FD
MTKTKTTRKEASDKTKRIVWAKAAGRCQYPGCNDLLWHDFLTGKEDGNYGFIAHIVAAKETGPRGDAARSLELADDIENLMLLCYRHHHLIDVEQETEHPESLLIQYKKAHEARIELQTSLQEERSTEVVLFGATIGKNNSPISFVSAKDAILPERYPQSTRPIEIGLENSTFEDHQREYWLFQEANLISSFERKVRPAIEDKTVHHFSVFGLAPQPLLIKLGHLFSDIPNATIFQLHREPVTWKWLEGPDTLGISVVEPKKDEQTVALKIGLSATINDDRVLDVLGNDTAIWSIEVAEPHNDVLRTAGQLQDFRTILRSTLNKIKARHGEDKAIFLFPAMPVACAIEVGRVWMAKSDLPLKIFDQNRTVGGFIPTIDVTSDART